MTKVTKSSGVGGKWLDKASLKTGDVAKIKTEATEEPSQLGGTQLVAKLHVKGHTEPANIAINKPSKNALIDAFGDDTKNWVDKLLTINVERTIISGKRGYALYLVPEGFEVGEDSGGYIVVSRIGGAPTDAEPKDTVEYPEEDINPNDIPF